MDFKTVIQKTIELNTEFDKKGSAYSKQTRLIDLVEEVGELAQAVNIVEGFKYTKDPRKQKTREDIADAICDCLYELVLLAQDYDLDLEQEYLSVLDHLKQRLDSSEFSK